MFDNINRSRSRFYLANVVTLGIYGALYVIFRAHYIGSLVGRNFPTVGMGLLLTVLTLGIYPCVMLSVLAYKLAPLDNPTLGHTVLALNLASLITAIISGGFFMVISVALFTHADWLVVNAVNKVESEAAPNISVNTDALKRAGYFNR